MDLAQNPVSGVSFPYREERDFVMKLAESWVSSRVRVGSFEIVLKGLGLLRGYQNGCYLTAFDYKDGVGR